MSRDTRKIEDIYQELLLQQEIASNAEIEMIRLQQALEKKTARKNRYWQNKEEENLRSKIWRLQQRLDKMVEERKLNE
jgi:hypothetical protein